MRISMVVCCLVSAFGIATARPCGARARRGGGQMTEQRFNTSLGRAVRFISGLQLPRQVQIGMINWVEGDLLEAARVRVQFFPDRLTIAWGSGRQVIQVQQKPGGKKSVIHYTSGTNPDGCRFFLQAKYTPDGDAFNVTTTFRNPEHHPGTTIETSRFEPHTVPNYSLGALAILGIRDDQPTWEQIVAAYRAKVRKLHPDVNPDPEAESETQRVNDAYERLEKQKDGAQAALYPTGILTTRVVQDKKPSAAAK